jgi:serine/threonine protein phosphatase PrpC
MNGIDNNKEALLDDGWGRGLKGGLGKMAEQHKKRADTARYLYCCFTHHGVAGYENQDSIMVNEKLLNACSLGQIHSGWIEGKRAVAAVADGLSVSPHAATASRLVLEEVQKHVYYGGGSPGRELSECIRERLAAHVATHPECRGMGATLAGVVLDEERGVIFNTGDSRVYLYRDRKLKRRSRDHTQAQRMLDAGEMTSDEYEYRSDIYNMLEGYYSAQSLFDEEIPPKHVELVSVKEGDIFLVCTDGVTDVLSDETIEGIMRKSPSLHAVADAFKERIMSAAEDNLSFALLQSAGD